MSEEQKTVVHTQVFLHEVVLDPKMQVGTAHIGDVPFNFLRIEHPRHGVIDIAMPKQTMINLGNSLLVAAQTGEAKHERVDEGADRDTEADARSGT